MAIGANWAEIWGPVWKEVWTQEAAQPEPEVEAQQTPAGRSRRRYFVEVDGQQFLVNSVAEAQAILAQARALAERQAEVESEKAVQKLSRKRKIPKVAIAAPVVTASPEIKQDLAPLIADIERLYKQAAVNAELRLRLAQMQKADDDEEDDLLLLL